MASSSNASVKNVDLMYITIESTISLASVLGNVLVIVVVALNRTFREPTFCFIVSLAMADIAVGALVIPLAIILSLGLETSFYICLFLSCLIVTITQSSILSLLAIAIDRYLRIKIPTRYYIIVTQQRAWVAVGLCWMLSFVIGFVPMFGWHKNMPNNSSKSSIIQCKFTSVISMDYMVYFNFLGCVAVPLIIMSVLYAGIFFTIHRQLNHRAKTSTDSSKYLQKELKLAKSLALVLFLFVLCWIPLHIMNFVSNYCHNCIPAAAFYVGIFMSHLNSALNPLVYAFRIQRFRDTLIQIGQRFVLCKSNSLSPCPADAPVATADNTASLHNSQEQ